jgi:undecaprenyl-diphosphatase
MINGFDMLILGLIQGLTEFLPISSSGHLVLAQRLLHVSEPGIAVEIVLHLGSLLAVVLYFRNDLIALLGGWLRWMGGARDDAARSHAMLSLAIAIGTVPAVIAGFAGGSWLEGLYKNPREASIELLVTAAILISTLFVRRGNREVGPWRAGWIGICQAVALLPGISRSGTTIAGGLYLGVRPDEAARFSFLLSIPAILGAGLLKTPAVITEMHHAKASILLLGFAVSFVVGYLSIAALMRVVRRGRFGFFGLYCILVGVAGLIWIR